MRSDDSRRERERDRHHERPVLPDLPCSPPRDRYPEAGAVGAVDEVVPGLVQPGRNVTARAVEDVVRGDELEGAPGRERENDRLPPVGNAYLGQPSIGLRGFPQVRPRIFRSSL